MNKRLNSAAENLKTFVGRKHEEPWKQTRSIGQLVQPLTQVHIHGQWMLPSLMHSFVGQSSIRELCPPAMISWQKKPFETGVDAHTDTHTLGPFSLSSECTRARLHHAWRPSQHGQPMGPAWSSRVHLRANPSPSKERSACRACSVKPLRGGSSSSI